ncbi:InlB B-repeat-containing protein, partial [Breznakia pachnodae]
MKKIFKVFSAIAIVLISVSPTHYMISATDEENSMNSKIQIFVEDITVDKDDKGFTLLDGVSATDVNGDEVEVKVLDDGEFDVTTIGNYIVTYQAINPSDDSEVTKERVVTVENKNIIITTQENPVKKNLLRAGSVTVSNVTDLATAVANASEGDVITLDNGFVFASATIAVPNVNVIIEGNNLTWTTGLITFNGSGTGSITLQNLNIDGTTSTQRLMSITNSAGQVILEGLDIKNAQKGAIYIGTQTAAKTTINNTRIADGVSSDTASAIYFDGYSNIDINYSTIENNVGSGAGWEAGALATKGYRGTLNINNSVFKNNKNKSANTGIYGGGGGAIEIHYMYAGVINIKESYFIGNEANGTDSAAASTYDGGAIYVFDGRDGSTINIDKTTFESNISHDDGGAIMFQGTGNPGLSTTISNSTFYNNLAQGLSGGNRSGGAIQFFKNGGSSVMTNKVSGCTFVGNTSGNENTRVEQRGGAIGLSGAGTLATATFTNSNSLYFDNQVYGVNGTLNTASNYKDTSNTSTTTLTSNLIGADRGGLIPPHTRQSIFGSYGITLSENHSSIIAGVNGEIVKTIPIMPEGLAENKSTNAVTGTDQRSYTKYKDIGAVEASWVKYDANGGSFTLPALSAYNGTEYYEGTTPVTYYDVGVIAGTSTVKNESDLAITAPISKTFLGWSTNKDATTADATYAPGNSITYLKDNQILYAIYGDVTFNITYDGNGYDGGTVPFDDTDYLFNQEVTVKPQGTMTRDGYKFIGWNENIDGNGITFAEGSSFYIVANTTLYAKWEELYTVTFDSQGGSSINPQTGLELGSKVMEPVIPTKDGYSFDGWYTDTTYTTVWDFNTDTIVGNMTLYAKWNIDDEKNLYTVTFDSQGGSSINPQTGLERGSKVMEPVIPTKDGYSFDGWYTDTTYTTVWD